MTDTVLDDARELIAFTDRAPSPFHAVSVVARRLEDAGFTPLDEREQWDTSTGLHYIERGGSLVAWALPDAAQLDAGFRVIGAHTDSPNLRVKPRPDTGRVGFRQLGVEVYGGVLLNSWLDRDLGLSGRVALRGRSHGDVETRLLHVERPLLRIPQLAIHLDRGVNEKGLVLNPQQHLVPIWGLGRVDEGTFLEFLAGELAVPPADVLAWDVMTHDLTPGALLGRDSEFVSSARIDNLLSCWAATRAITDSITAAAPPAGVPVICLFDHEEIGSESASGAGSTILPTILERIVTGASPDNDRDRFHRVIAASSCVSADGAHATHPNYAERHEPSHTITINAGPVIKINANVRYATDAPTAARFKLACERVDVPWQEFVTRTDLPCGSTIGPVTAAKLGMPTVDVGVAQLAMHSARELCGSADPAAFVRALASFLTSLP